MVGLHLFGEIAPAFGEIPAVVLWSVALLAAMGYLVARGTLAAYEHTVHRALGWLADHLKFSIFVTDIDLGGPIRSIDKTLYRWIGDWARGMDSLMGALFHYAAQVQSWTAHEIVSLSAEVLHFGDWLIWRHIPNLLRNVLKWSFPPYAIARLVQALIHANLPHVFRLTKTIATTIERDITQTIELPFRAQWDWLHRHWKELAKLVAAAGAVGGAIAVPWIYIFPRFRLLERFETYAGRRLRRLEALLGAAGIAAVMANALGLPNWRCITRGNLGRAARGICGMPSALLADLLGLLADFFVLENICAVIPWLEAAFADVAAPLIGILAKAGAGLCDASYSPGPPTTVPPLYLPSTVSTAIYTGP